MSSSPALVSPSLSAPFFVRFGASTSGEAGGFLVPIPVLAGARDERIFDELLERSSEHGVRLFTGGGILAGVVDESAEDDLAAQTRRIYGRILRVVGERRLARMWNYIPQINTSDASGLENYRAFCGGRSLAFEEHLGDAYHDHLPAASAVGGADGRLTVIFAATRARPTHVENPEQVPAYRYPQEHGPRAPSFARATRVEEAGRQYVFISGTAAIKGHATVAPNDLGGQIACTLDNLRIISRSSGLGERLGRDGGAGGEWRRHFKVYLRNEEDFEAANRSLKTALFVPGDQVTWLRSDICRGSLLIEIEATLVA